MCRSSNSEHFIAAYDGGGDGQSTGRESITFRAFDAHRADLTPGA
jgi:hypothetical protein